MNKIYFINFNELLRSNLTFEGYYVNDSENRYYLKDTFDLFTKDKIKLDIKEKDINNKTYIKDAKIQIPKVKLNLLNDKLNFKKVKSNSDYFITSYDSFKNKLYTRYNKILITVGEFINLIKENNISINPDLFTKINSLNYSDYLLHIDYFNLKNNYFESYIKTYIVYCKEKDYLSYFTPLVNSSNVILGTDLIKLIGNDQTILTENDFDGIYKMIDSSDKDNISLAFEMLANCNYSESADFISFFIYFYGEKFQTASNYNNVNVKGMRQYFNKYTGTGNKSNIMSYKHFLVSHSTDNTLTKFIYNKVTSLLSDFLNNSILIDKKKDVFIIDPNAILPGNQIKFK
jgi:hypothetical protein